MSTVRDSIEVAVPARLAYEQLAHFENYPQFMSGVMDVTPLTDTTAHMVLDIGGNRAEFDACITEARPGEFLCWEATSGPQVSEAVRLEPVSDSMTRVIAELQIDAQQLMPSETHANDVLNRRLKADLRGFKRFCEEHATVGLDPTGTAGSAPNPATVARGIASARGVSHAINERPMMGVPPGGNLGPLQNTAGRTMQGRPGPSGGATAQGRATTGDPAARGRSEPSRPPHVAADARQDGMLRRDAYPAEPGNTA